MFTACVCGFISIITCIVLCCIVFIIIRFLLHINIWTIHSIMQVNKNNYNIYKHATILYNHKQYMSAIFQYTQTTIYSTYMVINISAYTSIYLSHFTPIDHYT
jgi:hypothetical protein